MDEVECKASAARGLTARLVSFWDDWSGVSKEGRMNARMPSSRDGMVEM